MNNEFKRDVVSPTEEVFTRNDDLDGQRLMLIAKRIYEKMEKGYDLSDLMSEMNLTFVERMEIEKNIKSIKESYASDIKRNTNRHKIKSRKKYEEEINEEKRNVTLNSLAVGVTALASIVCFSVAFGGDFEFERTISTFLLGTMSTGVSVPTIKALVESISRKAKLEDSYKINYKIDELTKEEKRGKSL